MKTTLLAPVAALALLVPMPAQVEPAVTVTSVRSFVLESGTIQLGELIDRVAAFLDFNLLYSEQEVTSAAQGGIRLTRRTEVDRDGCWELFNSLLYHKGFAILTMDRGRGFYEIVNVNGPRAREVTTGPMFVPSNQVEEFARLKAIPILTSVPLQNVNATIATNALRPFFASMGGSVGSLTLGNVGNSSDLLLQGYGPQVAAACRLLKLIDTGEQGGTPEMQVVALEHAASEDVVQRLEDTLGSTAMQQAAQGMMPQGIELRVVPHSALNAVILSGSQTQLRQALDLIARLDRPAQKPHPTGDELRKRLEQLEQRVQQLEQAKAREAGGGR